MMTFGRRKAEGGSWENGILRSYFFGVKITAIQEVVHIAQFPLVMFIELNVADITLGAGLLREAVRVFPAYLAMRWIHFKNPLWS
jgi:hypothetical protein